MKIKIIATAIVIFSIVILSVIIITNRNKHILYLSNGEIIEVTKTWEGLGDIYYEQENGTLGTLKEGEVDKIVSTSLNSLKGWKIVLTREIELKRGIFEILLDKNLWIGCLLAFCFYCAGVFVDKLITRIRKRKKVKTKDEDELIIITPGLHDTDMRKIILYFLNLYMLHLGANKDDRFQYKRLNITGHGKTVVYDLRIFHDDKWIFRRMSLGRIGEDSGARSKCFYVIYDDHIVIKIPPEPINDFDQYINCIKADKRIADLLAPRECLIPKVSTVLKRIPSFADSIGRYAKENEQVCIDGLNKFPNFQQFLKIGENFAFFMDLSKYYFLGLVLDELHDVYNKTSKEIKEHQGIIWDSDLFEERYGKKASNLCINLQHAFQRFENIFINTDIQSYQKKDWFSGCLCIGETDSKQKNIPNEAAEILKQVKKEHKDTFAEYETVIKNYVQEKSFQHNRTQIQCICTNLIELLSWLHIKKVAMRDLKPDNLIVVGDPSKYPQFLKSSDEFHIGLIDVETAASINPKEGQIEQPKLGLTPIYATPSHMLINEILGVLYADPIHILQLQDWQAIVGMIYKSVTGEHLFYRAAGTIGAITKEMPCYFGDIPKLVEFSMSASARFWKDASNEFVLKMQSKQKLLKSVNLEICTNAEQMFKNAAAKSRNKNIQKKLLDIKPNISAHELLYVMFSHLYEMMCKKDWEPYAKMEELKVKEKTLTFAQTKVWSQRV
ncbi:MAG: hypothetical protein KKC46_21250 [Proteobacteria bacterium]|nr:hypothetical protein [Pseudomonadota bacterium]